MLEQAGIVFSVYSLYDENPVGSLISSLLWMGCAWGASSIVMYNVPSATLDAITYTGETGLIYLFAGLSVVMFLNTLRTAFKEVEREVR